MVTNDAICGAPDILIGWRFKVGVALFALVILSYLLIPVEAALNISAGTIATIAAGIAITNNIVLLIAIVVLGKPGFAALKAKFVHKFTPPVVSPIRYRIGLVMFCIPFVKGVLDTWSAPMSPHLVGHQLWMDALMNGIFVASVFVLGGEFWDKLRALFFVDARAVFHEDSNRISPRMTVSRSRYTIGLAMFCFPFLQLLLETWAVHITPQLIAHHFWAEVLKNGIFVASVFVLGGEFWDKIRALFFVDARALFPSHSNTIAAGPFVR